MRLLPRLAQVEERAPRHHLAPVREESLQHLLEIENARLPVDQRHHVDAEGVLELRLLEEVVEDDFGQRVALQLDDRPHAGLVRLVLDVRDALDLLLVRELADPREQHGLVHLVGDLVDDDRLAVAFLQVLEVRARAHQDAAAAGAIAFAHAGHAVDDPRRREVRRRDVLDQLVDPEVGLLEQCLAGVHHLPEVVGRDVGRHAHGDSRGAVDEQVRDLGRQRRGFLLLAVVVRDEIDGFLLDVGEQLRGDAVQAALGVAVGRSRVAVDRAEVPLPVDQRVAHGEVLRHAHQRLVGGVVAVRMVFAEDVADHARAFHVRPVPHVVRLEHREEHPAVHRLQPVAHVRQRAPHDHAHRVIEVGAAHLLFQADGKSFLGELIHERGFFRAGRAF